MLYLLAALILWAILYTIYRLWPDFGGRVNGDRLERALKNAQFKSGKFQNLVPTPMDIGFRQGMSILYREFKYADVRRPKKPLEPDAFDIKAFLSGTKTKIVWLGHSTVLLRTAGKTILFDPVFSKRTSPFQWIGPKRFAGALRLTVADLPDIDAVVISHDHYDHLDYASIRQLRNKARQFFVPLGVGAHLERWGIALKRIHELEWWQHSTFEGIMFICTPARHFSGRRIKDRAATLWASWVIQTKQEKIFFSGDTSYGPHFAEIGKRYGSFDFAMLECGQYDPVWVNVHMLPEQTIQAAQDLNAKVSMPIHWGSFVLALHPWTDPVQRAGQAAKKVGIPFITPRLGEMFSVSSKSKSEAWWPSA